MKHKRTISAICKTNNNKFLIKTRDSEYIWNGPLTVEDLDGEDEEWASGMMQTCDRILEWTVCGGSTTECPAYISWSPYKKPMLCVDHPLFRARVQPLCHKDDPEWRPDPDGPGDLV